MKVGIFMYKSCRKTKTSKTNFVSLYTYIFFFLTSQTLYIPSTKVNIQQSKSHFRLSYISTQYSNLSTPFRSHHIRFVYPPPCACPHPCPCPRLNARTNTFRQRVSVPCYLVSDFRATKLNTNINFQPKTMLLHCKYNFYLHILFANELVKKQRHGMLFKLA